MNKAKVSVRRSHKAVDNVFLTRVSERKGLAEAVLSVCVEDRMGLVWLTTELLQEHEADIEACNGVRLNGVKGQKVVYGAMIRFQVSRPRMKKIARHYKRLREQFARLPREKGPQLRYRLSVLAPNRPGIVAKVSTIIKRRGCSIVTLWGKKSWDPDERRYFFFLEMKVDAPRNTALRVIPKITAQLAGLERDHDWSVELEPLKKPRVSNQPAREFCWN